MTMPKVTPPTNKVGITMQTFTITTTRTFAVDLPIDITLGDLHPLLNDDEAIVDWQPDGDPFDTPVIHVFETPSIGSCDDDSPWFLFFVTPNGTEVHRQMHETFMNDPGGPGIVEDAAHCYYCYEYTRTVMEQGMNA